MAYRALRGAMRTEVLQRALAAAPADKAAGKGDALHEGCISRRMALAPTEPALGAAGDAGDDDDEGDGAAAAAAARRRSRRRRR